ncbi:MAG: hypothetical protein J5545_05550 [Bacteroidaceae bacterium]|nr:hypothetical protein [Bacteroidaceae bacterium]
MDNKKRIECLIANVDKMRENTQEMRMWKNIPLAKECVQLLRDLDDPEETPMGKALACEAIIAQLPEYDVPRLVLSILRYKLELIQQSDEQDPERYPTAEEVQTEIQRLEDYIDTEHVGDEEFRERYHRHLKSAPIERTPLWEENYYEVEQECDRRLGDTPRGMGFCFAYWPTLRSVLAERGILWQSPHELNPHVMFD